MVIFTDMKTIAITIEENMLLRIDRLVSSQIEDSRNRSQIIRQAVSKFVEQREQQNEEAREREIFQRHRQRLARQADALVKEQAKI